MKFLVTLSREATANPAYLSETCTANPHLLIKVRNGNADQPLALAVDDDGLIAMVDAQKQVLINPNPSNLLLNFQESEDIATAARIRKVSVK